MLSRDTYIVGGRIQQILDTGKWDELLTKRIALRKQWIEEHGKADKSFERFAKDQGLGGDDFPISIEIKVNDSSSFKEEEHPRGQPKNAGQFGSSSGGSRSSKTSKKKDKAEAKAEKDYTSPEGKESISAIFKDVVSNVSLKMEVVKSKTRENESLISVQGRGLKYSATIDTLAKDFFVDEVHISRTEQGKGIGKSIIKNTVAFAKQEGLHTISLYAGEKVGIYAWAKLGFEYALPSQLGDAKNGLKIFAKNNGVLLTHDQLNQVKRAKDVAEFKIPGKKVKGMEFGKAFMLDSHGAWSGELRL